MGKELKYLAIAGASNYSWKDMKIWVRSLKMSGFKGDIVIVATNIAKETVEKLASEGVKVEIYGKDNGYGSYVSVSAIPPHVERMLYMWNYLDKNELEYDYVITTDIRDVLFQTNPSDWIDNNVKGSIIASCEMIRYENEPWNNQNLLEAFGPFFHDKYKDMNVYNVGVLAGTTRSLKDLLFMIFQMSTGRPIKIVDQVVFNVLLRQYPIWSNTQFTFSDDVDTIDPWAIQLGTTEEAVKSGAGDLGMMYRNNLEAYRKLYMGKQPSLDEEGYVVNENGKRFCIVHQYDRTHAWKNKIIARYDDNEETAETWVYGH
jgi:hypothetical protein